MGREESAWLCTQVFLIYIRTREEIAFPLWLREEGVDDRETCYCNSRDGDGRHILEEKAGR